MSDWVKSFDKVKGVTLDITPRCTMLCNKCGRQTLNDFPTKMAPKMSDMTLPQYTKIVDYFEDIRFIGSFGDAVLHRDFHTMLSMAYERKRKVQIATAVSHRTHNWYKKAYEANPDATWIFGIDGMPEDSHKYRINQDGKHLFELMKLGKQMGINVVWQYIIFKYNQNDIEKAKTLANSLGIKIQILKSKRFDGPDDPLLPDPKFANLYYQKEDTSKLSEQEMLQRYFRYNLQPKCLHKNAFFATHPQGYLLPCCWLTNYDVEEKFPELCNPDTHLDNINSIEEIINSKYWNKHLKKLEQEDKDLPYQCWRKCHMGAPLPKSTYEGSTYDRTKK